MYFSELCNSGHIKKVVLTVLVFLLVGLPFAYAYPPIRVMPLGDSITAGYTDNPTWSEPFGYGYRSGLYTQLTDAGYPFLFVGSSQEPWVSPFGTVTSVSTSVPDLQSLGQDYHHGYGGWGTANILSNVNSWVTYDTPDVVLLMAGINDIAQGSAETPVAAQNNLDSIVQTIVTQSPDTSVIVAKITPYATYTDSIVQYNDYIENELVPKYVGLGNKVSMVDQYSNFLTNEGQIDTTLFSNGLNHPNAAGYELMAETWREGILKAAPIPVPPNGSLVGIPTSPTETTVPYPQVGFGFYMTEPCVTINRLGYYDDGDDGLLEEHTVALYQHVGGSTPYKLIAKATIPAGTDATLDDGYRWIDIPEMEITDTRGPGDYFILTSSAGTDVRHEPAVDGLPYDTAFGTLTGDSLWLGTPLSEINIGDCVAFLNNTIGSGGYSGANMGYFVEVQHIAGDANGDGKVDGSDVTILAGNWQTGVGGVGGATWDMGDFNGDGAVDGSDVTILAGNWQYGVNATASPVPEPSTLMALLVTFVSLLVWKRTR